MPVRELLRRSDQARAGAHAQSEIEGGAAPPLERPDAEGERERQEATRGEEDDEPLPAVVKEAVRPPGVLAPPPVIRPVVEDVRSRPIEPGRLEEQRSDGEQEERQFDLPSRVPGPAPGAQLFFFPRGSAFGRTGAPSESVCARVSGTNRYPPPR